MFKSINPFVSVWKNADFANLEGSMKTITIHFLNLCFLLMRINFPMGFAAYILPNKLMILFFNLNCEYTLV